MHPSLRQRIRKHGINCLPWKVYRYEVQRLPVSSQCLFKKGGVSLDVLETELISEGWLFDNEKLIEVLSTDTGVMRKHSSKDYEDSDFGMVPDDFTEEDYLSNGL